jgi:hypothetical protein
VEAGESSGGTSLQNYRKVCTEDFHATKSSRREERNRRLGFAEEIRDFLLAVRSREVAQGLSPSEQRRSPGGVIGVFLSKRIETL